MSKSVEVVNIMSPKERKEALEIDARRDAGIKVGYYLMRMDDTLRVEVLPKDDIAFGLRVLNKELGNEVYRHPYAFIGQLAVGDAMIESAIQAA